MSLTIIKGDLFDPDLKFDALAQGVNAQGLMGAGIAVPFRRRWPAMYVEYREECTRFPTLVPGTTLAHDVRPESDETGAQKILNMFTQVMPGRGNAEYRLVRAAAYSLLKQLPKDAIFTVGLPWVGCGIGGLERHNVEHLLRQIWDDSQHEFFIVEQ